MKDFSGKIAFITGGASGAGFGQAQIFSEAGMKVVIADVRDDLLDEAITYFKEKKADVHAVKLDVTDREGYAKAADEVERIYGAPPDLLIMTAGVNVFGPAEASTFEDFDWVMGVCFWGVVNGLITFVPRMIKAAKGGHIAATISWGAFGADATTAPYRAAKAGALNVMESYYLALKPYGFGATALCPSNINSEIWATELRRPEKYKNTGYNTTPEVIELMKEHVSMGIDPVELAVRFKKAIEDGVVYCIPYPDAVGLVTNALDRKRNYLTPGGMAKERGYDAYMAELTAEHKKKGLGPPVGDAVALFNKGDEVGFAKARPDIDWVADSRKLKK